IIGIVAAKINPKLKVFMTDINERAVWLARKNAELNQVKNIKVLQGDLYKPVINQKFDAIITNPPIHAGLKTVFEIIEKSPNHLNQNGTLQIVAKTKLGAKRIAEKMLQTYKNVKEISKKSGYRVLLSRRIYKE
ncbi:MAG: class I SAM-dependent methyltransferase, partial [Candidatus Baldrarchaeia archaeon]